MKHRKNRGQVGPFSLEVLFPTVIALIIIFVFIAATLTVVMKNLEQRRAEATYKAAQNTVSVLYSRSRFLYGNNPGLFAKENMGRITCEELNKQYGVTGYTYTLEITDTTDDISILQSSCPNPGKDTTALATPIAIRYSEDKIHTGTLNVKIWKN